MGNFEDKVQAISASSDARVQQFHAARAEVAESWKLLADELRPSLDSIRQVQTRVTVYDRSFPVDPNGPALRPRDVRKAMTTRKVSLWAIPYRVERGFVQVVHLSPDGEHWAYKCHGDEIVLMRLGDPAHTHVVRQVSGELYAFYCDCAPFGAKVCVPPYDRPGVIDTGELIVLESTQSGARARALADILATGVHHLRSH